MTQTPPSWLKIWNELLQEAQKFKANETRKGGSE